MKKILFLCIFFLITLYAATAISVFDVRPDDKVGDLSYTGADQAVDNYYIHYRSPRGHFILFEAYDRKSELNAKKSFEIEGLDDWDCSVIDVKNKEIKKCSYTDYSGKEQLRYYLYYQNLFMWAETSGEGNLFSKELDVRTLIEDVISKFPQEQITKIDDTVSVKAPNVVTKRVTAGTINVQDGEIVFEISNEDANHKLEGYLACDIPSDVIVTGSMGAATGEQAQYISQTFTVDPAPARESMSLRLSSQNEGNKNVRCSINYVLFKEGKGYITTSGQYSFNKKYQQITLNRDIQFKEFEDKAKSDIATYWYFIAGIGVFVLLLIGFLIYKLGHVSGQVKKKK